MIGSKLEKRDFLTSRVLNIESSIRQIEDAWESCFSIRTEKLIKFSETSKKMVKEFYKKVDKLIKKKKEVTHIVHIL